MPSSTTFEEQDAAAKDVEQQMLALDGVKIVQTTVGSAADGRVAFGAAARGIAFSITAEEDASIEDLQAQVLNLETPADSEITTSQGGGFGSSETIDIEISASDKSLLQDAVNQVAESMKGLENITAITTTLEADERVMEIKVDREKAASYLLTETQVTGIVASQLRPSPLGTLRIEEQETQVFIAGQRTPESIDEVRAIRIPTFQGLVRLDEIASVEEVLKPTSITSQKGNRTAEVQLTPEGDDLGAITVAINERLAEIELPLGVEATVGGAAADQAESFQQLGLALLAAVAIVYIVMVATFSSLIQPLLLLISIPFAATGALGLLIITDTPLGVPALIGMLMLIGIVVTNAIVLIDLVNQYRKEGRSVIQSLFDGARQRLRPILMTALATIFALTPMALGLTGDSGFISKPLAIVVIGGLFSSTLLTLILVPTLYWLVEGRRERKQLRAERKAARKAKRTAKKSPEAPAVSQSVKSVTITEEKVSDSSMQWSQVSVEVTPEDLPLDDETQMRWGGEVPNAEPLKAKSNEGMPEFLTSELPIIQQNDKPTRREIREAKREAKLQEKLQRKAQKNARHSDE
jgi:HAE1 family hydrophobic/amphiphilic exporter-1